MKSMKPNNVFAPYDKQGQRSAIFHGFFFLIGKGETRDTGDTGDTTGHRGHKWTQGTHGTQETQGTQGRQGDTRGHRTKGTNIVFDLSFT